MELEALQEISSEVEALGEYIVVLPPEIDLYTRAMRRKLNLTYDILTDLHLIASEKFGLVFTLPDSLRELYSKSFGVTLDRPNDEPQYRLPVPARYVIDKQGVIRSADVDADYTIRTNPYKTLMVVRTLAPRTAP